MQARHWINESWRFGLGIAIVVLAGVITGLGIWLLLSFLLLYGAWMIYRFHQLEQWLIGGSKKKKAPDVTGIAAELVQLISRDRRTTAKQKERLRKSLIRFNDMAAELPDATVVLDENLQIRWCNEAARPLLKLSRQYDTGMRIDNLIRQPEFHDFLQHSDPTTEVEITAPGDPTLTLALRRVPSGKSMSLLTARDVTQRVKIREMRKTFVADVSHELRTPLTVIRGYLEMLIEDQRLPEEVQSVLASVGEQSERMSHIVNDLLTLSKLESSSLPIDESRPVAVAGIIRQLANELNPPPSDNPAGSPSSSHQITTNTDASLQLLGSDSEIYSICQNLIQNAIKYTPAGSRVDVRWQRNESGATLTIADNGPGIDAKHLPRLTERFYRVDTGRSRAQGGTGLGLAIVKYIAQRHGGLLRIDSVPGHGSEFAIDFPAERIIESPQTASESAGDAVYQ